MKALEFFLLIGLVYGFEGNNQFIVRQANLTFILAPSLKLMTISNNF